MNRLDPDGDVTLSVTKEAGDASRSFLVSSKVLMLSSNVFAKMLGSNLKEGIAFQSGQHLSIRLEGDDPETMELILRVLHYQASHVPLSMEPKQVAALAVHADKYALIQALKPWVLHWCSVPDHDLREEDYGCLLLATHMFHSPQFPKIALFAAKRLKPSFLSAFDDDETLALLPPNITSVINSARVEAVLLADRAQIRCTIKSLRLNTDCTKSSSPWKEASGIEAPATP